MNLIKGATKSIDELLELLSHLRSLLDSFKELVITALLLLILISSAIEFWKAKNLNKEPESPPQIQVPANEQNQHPEKRRNQDFRTTFANICPEEFCTDFGLG